MQGSLMERVDVSPEMVALVGSGPVDTTSWPVEPVAFLFDLGAADLPATSRFHSKPDARKLNEDAAGNRLILIVARDACGRIFDHEIGLNDGEAWHLPPALRAIGMAIRDCALPEAARHLYRLGKSIELLCETFQLLDSDDLVPVGCDVTLSRMDTHRLLIAHRMIEERWSEKLTIDMIARASGLNRAKLTRGFREMFDCSVADAIADQRLGEAGQMLIATDLPVSSIGYRCGYLNNASFTRAFARRFGQAPTLYRASRLAA